MKIQKQDLMVALETAINGCKSVTGDLVGDTNNFLFKDGSIYSWSSAISVKMKLPEDCKELVGVVKGTDLIKIIKRIKEVDFDITATTKSWAITTDTITATMPCKEDNISDRIETLAKEKLEWNPLPPKFYKALRVCYMQRNTTQFNGIFFTGNHMWALDNVRVVKANMGASIDSKIYFSSNSAHDILGLSQVFDEIAITKTWVHFRSFKDGAESAVFSCNRYDSALWYPKAVNAVSSIIEETKCTEESPRGVLPPLKESIALTQVFAIESETEKNIIQMTFSNKNLILSATKRGSGNVKEKLKWTEPPKGLQDKVSFYIASNILQECLTLSSRFHLVQTNGKATLALSDDDFQVVIKSVRIN